LTLRKAFQVSITHCNRKQKPRYGHNKHIRRNNESLT